MKHDIKDQTNFAFSYLMSQIEAKLPKFKKNTMHQLEYDLMFDECCDNDTKLKRRLMVLNEHLNKALDSNNHEHYGLDALQIYNLNRPKCQLIGE